MIYYILYYTYSIDYSIYYILYMIDIYRLRPGQAPALLQPGLIGGATMWSPRSLSTVSSNRLV